MPNQKRKKSQDKAPADSPDTDDGQGGSKALQKRRERDRIRTLLQQLDEFLPKTEVGQGFNLDRRVAKNSRRSVVEILEDSCALIRNKLDSEGGAPVELGSSMFQHSRRPQLNVDYDTFLSGMNASPNFGVLVFHLPSWNVVSVKGWSSWVSAAGFILNPKP
mmetsp:Transcript_24933/g.39111  ORF Transcript_24933/g.39111 Transcript_24933/m.39111 type:complete len:162 (-) Transcript_24933:13-498(-)